MSEIIHGAPCPLIDALPVEIRVQIYEYVLFENGSFFSLDDEQEGKSVPTLFPKLRAPPRQKTARQRRDVVNATEDEEGQQQGRQDPLCTGPNRGNSGNIMTLLTVSKQIYNEAASLLYSTSFFRLRGIHSTIQFVNTVRTIHLAQVRSLKLVWDDQGWTAAPEFDTPTLRAAWPSLCDALAHDFHALRNLYVALGMPSSGAGVEALYLGGLAGVRHVENFKVCIPVGFLTRYYGVEETGDAEEDWPFTLCRHTAGEVCNVRREVITAEWRGDSRPATPGLKVDVPNVPGLEPWADGEWEEGAGKEAVALL